MKKTKSNDYGVSVRIRKETREKLKQLCKKKGIIAMHLASDAIEERIERINEEDGN